MKYMPAQIAFFLRNRQARRNIRLLGLFSALLVIMVLVFSVVFHLLMAHENQHHTWLTGFYWTLTVMTTLGFGDITFHSDAGRVFSVVVLLSGVLFMLVVLPFAFIQFFLAPWLEAQSLARAPRSLSKTMAGHVLITSYDSITENLIRQLVRHGFPYAVITPDLNKALELHDLGVRVVMGALDDPLTYEQCRIHQAALVLATGNDMVNTSITLTVRELSATAPIVANAELEDSVDVLQLAGATHTLQFKTMLGRFLARRAIGMSTRANIIGGFGDLVIAEASATRSPLVGRTIEQAGLREATGVTVVGLWERGHFEIARPDSQITSASVLVLAGTREQMQSYDELFCIYVTSDAPVMILGGGSVGQAVAKALEEREIDYRIVEQNAELATTPRHVLGSAADLATLEAAGLREAHTCIVTTSNDDINIYLTVYCRRLCPDMQIISRANFEKNISTLHRAGADIVMSYASMGAGAVLNILEGEDVLLFAEGLNVFRIATPANLVGLALRDTQIREQTGCYVIGVEANGHVTVNPTSDTVLKAGEELILIGDAAGEQRALEIFRRKPENR